MEPSLQSAWVADDTQLIASMSYMIVKYGSKVSSLDTEMKKTVQASLAKLLRSMKSIVSSRCDIGITNAVTSTDLKYKEEEETMIRELLQLSGHLNAEHFGGKQNKQYVDRDINYLESGNELEHLLPPMMALEHPNNSVRIQAVSSLERLSSDGSDINEIASALLRRFVSDDDPFVASKSVETLLSFHARGNLLDSYFMEDQVVEDVIFGVNKWSIISSQLPTMDEHTVDILRASISLAALCSQATIKYCNVDEMDESHKKNIFNLVSTISKYALSHEAKDVKDDSNTISESSVQSLLQSIDEKQAKSTRRNNHLKIICENEHFQNIVKSCIDSKSITEETKQFLCLFLGAWKKIASSSKPPKHTNSIVLAAAISILSVSKDEKSSESKLVKDVLEHISSESIESSINLAIQMTSLPVSAIFHEFGAPTIKKVYEEYKHKSPETSIFFILEAMTRPSSTSKSTERLMNLLDEVVSSLESVDRETCVLILLTTLSMFGHPELVVRECALDLFSKSCRTLAEKDKNIKDMKIPDLSNSSLKSIVLMDGNNSLPQILRYIIKNCDDAQSASFFLLKACGNMAQTSFSLIQDNLDYCCDGFCHTTSIVLSAMETAGERYFPLSKRWEIVGKGLFDFFVQKWPRMKTPSPSNRSLLETVVVMIKGVTIMADNIDEGIIITSHVTGTGRRSRSYSVGTTEGISCIHPYPADMNKAMLNVLDICLTGEMTSYFIEVFETMMNLVLLRTSWINGVFMKADKRTRKNIALKLLNLRSTCHLESAAKALLGLNLDCVEILHLLTSTTSTGSGNDSTGFLALTVITDCIRQQTESFGNNDDQMKLFSALFNRLSSLSNNKSSSFHDSCDYTRCSIIRALIPLSMKLDVKKKDKIDVGDYAKLLVDLLRENSDNCDVKPLLSGKSKNLALELLTNLCTLSPSTIVGSLVPAMINTINFGSSDNLNSTESAMIAIIPTYCQHAPTAGLALFDLLAAFNQHCERVKDVSWDQKLSLYTYFAKGLMLHAESDGLVMATVLTLYLASEGARANDRIKDADDINLIETPLNFTKKLLEQIHAQEQIDCSLKMLRYISNILPMLTEEKFEINDNTEEKRGDFFFISSREIYSIMFDGKQISEPTHENLTHVLWLIVTILNTLQRNVFSLPSVKRSIRNSDDAQARICLKIWQELSSFQSALLHSKHQATSPLSSLGKTNAWKSMEEDIGNILATVQMMLPTPHFLASVSSLLTDDGTSIDIKRGAIHLLADRSAEVEASSPEATLFLEMIPDLVNTATSKSNLYEWPILRQAAFRAIEQLSKNLGLSVIDDKLQQKRSTLFFPAFQKVTTFLLNENQNAIVTNASDELSFELQSSFSMQSQVLGSALLCTASLIAMLKAKCVSQLQILVKSLISILSKVNKCLRENKIEIGGSVHHSFKLIQLATMRAIVAIAETIPQFLTPFIESLLAPGCLPSIKVKHDSSDEGIAVITMCNRLEEAIATRSPVHLLIPTLSKSMKTCFNVGNADDSLAKAISILHLLKTSITQSSRSTLSPLVGKVLNALLQAYNHDCSSTHERTELLKQANETLLSLVLKLSESQLRPLYARLREWRGELDSSSNNHTTKKRYAFWSLSAAISQKLRNIFLPCMSSVVGDMVKELVSVSSLYLKFVIYALSTLAT